MNSKQTIVTNIKYYRGIKNLTQSALANKAGLSEGMICLIETNKSTPSITSLDKISRALEIPPYRLLMNDGDLFTKNENSFDECLEKIKYVINPYFVHKK